MSKVETNPLYNFSVGLDLLKNFPSTSNTYPPHNIIRKDQYNYRLEFAVAGFHEDQISIDIENSVLTVSGDPNIIDTSDTVGQTYLHRGIGQRAFKTRFQLAESIVVKEATVENGLLSIELEQIIPESAKKKSIPIKTRTKQILNG